MIIRFIFNSSSTFQILSLKYFKVTEEESPKMNSMFKFFKCFFKVWFYIHFCVLSDNDLINISISVFFHFTCIMSSCFSFLPISITFWFLIGIFATENTLKWNRYLCIFLFCCSYLTINQTQASKSLLSQCSIRISLLPLTHFQ